MKRKAKKKRGKKGKGFNLNGYIFGALRKIDRWYPGRREALALAEVGGKDGWFTCAKCDNIFPRKLVHVDHINPVVDPKTGFKSWDEYIARLFVPAEKRQILCKDCHKDKTNAENRSRRRK